MSLVALDGTPLIQLGFRQQGLLTDWTATNVTQDATNEAAICYGQIITDDGGSHTLDTSGSSSIGWRTGGVTFANAGTTFKVGLATMDTATGPPARATNASDVVTFSVSKSMTGGGAGVTANAWQAHTPDTGSLAVANGDFIAFCTQMPARGGADSILTTALAISTTVYRLGITSFVGGAYGAVAAVPNCIITFSDGHKGWFAGTSVFSTGTTTNFNSGSSPNERGNYFQAPFPMKIYGLYGFTGIGGDCDYILYSDPLGTPVAEQTVRIDANTVSVNSSRLFEVMFTSPYTTTANQPLGAVVKPATGSYARQGRADRD